MKYLHTFTIFGGDMRYIWIGKFCITITYTGKDNWWKDMKIEWFWDNE
jgi:hypothetical protein